MNAWRLSRLCEMLVSACVLVEYWASEKRMKIVLV